MKLSELQQKIPDVNCLKISLISFIIIVYCFVFKFPWIDFITNGMFLNNPDIKVNQSELVSINDWDYLVKMQTIYSNYSKNYPQ